MTSEGDTLSHIEWDRILELLRHRYPMLLVDRLEDMVLGESATGIKNVSFNEPFFQGHFPGHPVMPGVLIVEAMAQTAACLAITTLGPDAEGKVIYFMGIDGAKFRKPVRPGHQLHMKVQKLKARKTIWTFEGKSYVDDTLMAEANFTAMIMDS